ncbi:MAG TPA: class I SAM-dependent methyltransferase [Chloroflexia bacterium]|nr:class I SAM-dependent methyltransferase [Chloroflexia bacterium]
MERSLLERVRCPACGTRRWRIDRPETANVRYASGPVEEIARADVACDCGRVYPVRDYVLSLAQVFREELQREAAFWDRFYVWNIDHGADGFHDLKRGFAPYVAQGVAERFPFADTIERYDAHNLVARHPIFRAGKRLLDVGVGPGWTSIHFAREGYEVTAFDPSFGPLVAAKKYAIEQGLHVEYLCAAVGYVDFEDGVFDNVAAFHSLHHVPDVRTALNQMSRWLRPGGGLGIDEHIANSALARALGAELHRWAAENVFPRYRSISDAELAGLPSEPHSAMEDAGADQIVPLVRAMFDVAYEKQRHVVLDHYPLLYYLSKGKNPDSYVHALEIANHIQELLRLADPDGGEYVTIVASNRPRQ